MRSRRLDLIAGADSPMALVLDDYHLVESSGVHDLVTRLLGTAPAGFRLLIGSDMALPSILRLTIRQGAVELGVPELRFTPAEIATLCERHTGRLPDRRAVEDLLSKTAGQAAAISKAQFVSPSAAASSASTSPTARRPGPAGAIPPARAPQ